MREELLVRVFRAQPVRVPYNTTTDDIEGKGEKNLVINPSPNYHEQDPRHSPFAV